MRPAVRLLHEEPLYTQVWVPGHAVGLHPSNSTTSDSNGSYAINPENSTAGIAPREWVEMFPATSNQRGEGEGGAALPGPLGVHLACPLELAAHPPGAPWAGPAPLLRDDTAALTMFAEWVGGPAASTRSAEGPDPAPAKAASGKRTPAPVGSTAKAARTKTETTAKPVPAAHGRDTKL